MLLRDDAEAAGLLALMLLTDARRAARTGAARRADPARRAGSIALGCGRHSRRRRADLRARSSGSASARTSCRPPSPPCTTKRRAAETDWPQILALYSLLERMSDNPMVSLNRAIAVAMVKGADVGLTLLDTLTMWKAGLRGHYRLDAVRPPCSTWPAIPIRRASTTVARRRERSVCPAGGCLNAGGRSGTQGAGERPGGVAGVAACAARCRSPARTLLACSSARDRSADARGSGHRPDLRIPVTFRNARPSACRPCRS